MSLATCDGCDQDDAPTRAYVVAHHDKTASCANYCDDCATLARADWNGTTAAVYEVPTGDRLAEMLADLVKSWSVAITETDQGHCVILTSPSTGESYTYKGPDVAVLVRRAWAGVPPNA